ncbi:MAG: hypothetical protein KKG59_05625 [Nanoarchaeota archaeon]|nr:hypothetical protein [Nanoarchaeota archaeon]
MINLRKPAIGKLFLATLIVAIAIPSVSANIMPHFVSETLQKIFGNGFNEVWSKRSLIGLLLFSVFYFASTAIFKDKGKVGFKGVRITVSFVLAIISSISMPEPILLMIFQSLGSVTGVLLFVFPLVGFFFIAHKLFGGDEPFNHAVRALWYLLGIVFVSFIAKGVPWPPGSDMTVGDVGEIMIFIFFIMAIVSGARAIFGRGENAEAHFPGFGGGSGGGGRNTAHPAPAAANPAATHVPGAPAPAPRQPAPGPVGPGPMGPNLSNIIGINRNYQNDLGTFYQACNAVHMARNQIIAGTPVANYNALWDNMDSLAAQIAQLNRDFNIELGNIARMDITTMDVNQRVAFSQSINVHTAHLAELNTLINTFQDYIARSDPNPLPALNLPRNIP